MPENIISVGLKIKNQKVQEELKEVISSMEGFRIQNVVKPEGFDILIMEIGDNLENEFQFIHSIHDSDAVKEIFLTSSRTEPEILIQALRSGAKEFFVQPIKREEVRRALLNVKERVNDPSLRMAKGKIIDIIGSKGGVGTTTVAVNLAHSLIESEDAQSVALIDMNLIFGEIPLFLDLESTFNWSEVAKNISRVDSTFLMSIIFKHSSGIYVLPSPAGLEWGNIATPEIIEKLLYEMQNVFDFIVIDGGQFIDDISMKILEMSDTVLIVSLLSLPCFINVRRLLETFQRFGYPLEEDVKIIINRYHKTSIISPKEAEDSVNKKIFWFIPNDYGTTMSAINQGKPLSTMAPRSKICKNFSEFASILLGKKEEKKKEKAGFWRLKFAKEGVK